MSARVQLFDRKHGDTVIYDGGLGLEFRDFLASRGSCWGRVDIGPARMNGTFTIRYGTHEGRWWDFDQDNDYELLRHMLVPVNPAFEVTP